MSTPEMDQSRIEALLSAVGDHLAASRAQAAIVVVGGAALSLRRWVARTTEDVDVIAVWEQGGFKPPTFGAALSDAVARVARDFGVEEGWLNVMAGMQWRAGLPPNLADELVWLEFGALRVGVVGRRGLITLKLFAAADQGPNSVHAQDLIALAPSDTELTEAVDWVAAQDIAAEWPAIVKGIVSHVVRHRTPRG